MQKPAACCLKTPSEFPRKLLGFIAVFLKTVAKSDVPHSMAKGNPKKTKKNKGQNYHSMKAYSPGDNYQQKSKSKSYFTIFAFRDIFIK